MSFKIRALNFKRAFWTRACARVPQHCASARATMVFLISTKSSMLNYLGAQGKKAASGCNKRAKGNICLVLHFSSAVSMMYCLMFFFSRTYLVTFWSLENKAEGFGVTCHFLCGRELLLFCRRYVASWNCVESNPSKHFTQRETKCNFYRRLKGTWKILRLMKNALPGNNKVVEPVCIQSHKCEFSKQNMNFCN